MKNLSTLIIFFFCISGLQAQMYQDVNTLFNYFEESGDKTLEIGNEDFQEPLQILARYATKNENIEEFSPDEIINEYYIDNPFIGPNGIMKIMDTQNSGFLINRNAETGLNPPPSFSPTGPGGAIFDNFAKGLTMFIVQRFKQELSATFFKRFKRQLEEHQDLSIIFPQTFVMLDRMEEDIYQFNTYINELREVFVKDMRAMPGHAEAYLMSKEDSLIAYPELRYALADAFHITDMLLENNVKIYEVFDYLGENAYIQSEIITENEKIKDIRALLSISNEIIQSLRSYEFSQDFATRENFNKILKYDDALIIYCGLQYQGIKHIEFGNGVTASKFFHPDRRKEVANALQKAIAFGDHINDYKRQFDEIADNDSLRIELQYKVFQSIFDLLESQFGFVEKIVDFQEEHQDLIDKYMGLIDVIGEMSYDLKQENYSSAMINLSRTISLLPFKENQEVANVVMKYGTFASEVAEAQSPEQAKAVIERYAMPVGGSSKKKRSSLDISFNAYMGLGAGSETLLTDSTSHTASFVAISAPVGIAVSKGLGKKGALSLFFPIIDVGALATYRLNDNDFSNLPKLTFGNVFAPGGYLIYGFGNDIPLSLGAGVQLGPNLREVTNDAKFDVSEARGFRFGAFIAVDIPVFSIYSRGR